VRFLDAQPGWGVGDLDGAVTFYEALGFRRGYRNGSSHQVMHGGEVTIHLSTLEQRRGTCQIMVDDVAAFHELAASIGAEILFDGLGDRDWGCRDFTLRDPYGNMITFSQYLGTGTHLPPPAPPLA
jgi:catechol 2,3-dioxygenase-like lactoylglutathione lyase family enzyme